MKTILQASRKRTLIGVSAVFALTFLVLFIVGITGPSMLLYKTVDQSESLVNPGGKPLQFFLQIFGIDVLDQDLFLTATLENTIPNDAITSNFEMSVIFEGKSTNSPDSECSTGGYQLISKSKHSRTVRCHKGSKYCQNFTILHEPFLNHNCYRANVSFPALNVSKSADFAGDIHFNWVFFNPDFSLFEVWWRFSFLLVSLAVLGIYSFRLRLFGLSEWYSEQKWILGLLLGLVFFNNPLFPWVISSSDAFPHVLDTLFSATFICAILAFFITTIDGFRYPKYFATSSISTIEQETNNNEEDEDLVLGQPSDEDEDVKQENFEHHQVEPIELTLSHGREFSWKRFYIPKLSLVFFIWLWLVVAFSLERSHQLDDPSFESVYDIPGYQAAIIILFLMLLIYLFNISYVTIRAFEEVSAFHNAKKRFRVFFLITFLSIVVLVLSIIFSAFSPSRLSSSAASFLSTWSFWNLFVILLALLFSPSQETFKTRSLEIKSGVTPGGGAFAELSDTDEIEAGQTITSLSPNDDSSESIPMGSLEVSENLEDDPNDFSDI